MHLTSFHTGSAISAGMPLLLLAAPALATGQVEITPRVGVFAAAASIGQFETFELLANNLFALTRVQLRQSTAFLAGASATIWLSPRFGVEGTAWYAPSGVGGTATRTYSSVTGDVDVQTIALPGSGGHLLALSGRLLLRLPLASTSTAVFVLAGPGLLARAGDAWKPKGRTDATLVLGAGAHVALAPGLAARATLEDHLSNFGTLLQNDLVASVGLAIPVRRANYARALGHVR